MEERKDDTSSRCSCFSFLYLLGGEAVADKCSKQENKVEYLVSKQ